MIIDHDNKTVIGTPSKCGTMTVKHMVLALNKKEPERNVEWVRTGVHRCDCPPEAEGYTRLMMVRDPWVRLVSMWSFIAKPGSIGEWRHKEITNLSFTEFIDWWLKQRAEYRHPNKKWAGLSASQLWSAPPRWIMTLSEIADIWCPDAVIDIHHIEDGLFEHGIDLGKIVQSNTSKKNRPGHWTDYYTHKTFNRVSDAFAIKDADRFGFNQTPTIVNGILHGKHANDTIPSLMETMA